MKAAGRVLLAGELWDEIDTMPYIHSPYRPYRVVVKLTEDLRVYAVAAETWWGELVIDCTPFYAPEEQGNEELLAFVLDLAEERTPKGQPTALARRAQSVLEAAGY